MLGEAIGRSSTGFVDHPVGDVLPTGQSFLSVTRHELRHTGLRTLERRQELADSH